MARTGVAAPACTIGRLTTTSDPPPRIPRAHGSRSGDATLARVRALLDRSDYSASGIAAAGIHPGLGVRSTDVPALIHALDGPEPLRTLVQLFLLGRPIAAVDARRRLGEDAAALLNAGFVERDGAMLEPTLALTPWRGMVVAHDPDPTGDLWPEHVAGPNPATDTLASIVVEDRIDDALDLGTGSGALALLAARRARRVVATDVNPRALRYASINGELNDVANIEPVSGSLFEPLDDRRFGSIVSNPPFVISPESELVFRHSAFPRDDISRLVVRGVADHLEDGGFGHVLCNWVQPAGAPWREPVESWLAGSGCDVLVLMHGVESVLDYAVRWNTRRLQVAPDTYGHTIERWLAHAAAERIERITSAAVIVRRRGGGANWLHELELTSETRGAAGEHVRAIFRGVDHLHAHADDASLGATTVQVRSSHRLDQALIARGDGYVVEPGRLSLEEGFATSVTVPAEFVPVLLRLDGSRSVAGVAADVAADSGEAEETVLERTLAFVRELLSRGLAEPVEVAA
jgi:methylase of polypeptide subunit release factors